MADYGVTDTGFVKKRLSDIQSDIFANLQIKLGVTLQTLPNSVIGLLVGTFADREAALWDMGESVYAAQYPGTASGISLDLAVSNTGVTRFGQINTLVNQVIYGADGTIVPSGSQVGDANGLHTYTSEQDWPIDSDLVLDLRVSVLSIQNTATYTVVINATNYQYVTSAAATLIEIVNGLAAALLRSALTISTDGASVRVLSPNRATFTASVSSNLLISSLGSPATFVCDAPGPVEVAANTVTQIVSTTAGWASTNNLEAAVTGRYAENDAELRARYPRGVYGVGAGTIPALTAKLEAVSGVTTVKVIENDTDSTDANGRPSHSIECVVAGGDDANIASTIFTTKAGGITTVGLSSLNVLDAAGKSHPVRFSRPIPLYVFVKCVLTLNGEEVFPGNGLGLVAQSIVDTGSTLKPGDDVIAQRFFGPIFAACAGIGSIALSFSYSNDPAFVPSSGDYVSGNVSVPDTLIALFDLSRVSVS